jgi:WD40 repeat protein
LKHDETVNTVAFSPDGRRVVTASSDSTARIWDARTGTPVGARLQHQKAVVSAEFSPDGKRVVTASFDNTARVWDAETGSPLGGPLRHSDQVKTASFSPNGQRVLTASWDRTARIWQVLLDVNSGASVDSVADLAELAGGYHVNELGSVVALQNEERLERIRRIMRSQASAPAPFEQLLMRFHSAR